MLKQAKEREKEVEESNIVIKEHVNEALQEKWTASEDEEKILDGRILNSNNDRPI